MPETAVFFLTSSVVVNEMVPAEPFWNYKQWNDLRSDKWQSDCNRAVRYEDIYRMDEIKSLSFHIMFYHLFSGVAKYIVYGNTFSSFEWLHLYTPPTTGHEGETETGGERPARTQRGARSLNDYICSMVTRF